MPDTLTSGTQRRQNPGPCSGLWPPTRDAVTLGRTPHAEGARRPRAAPTPVPSMHCETWDETVLQLHDGRSSLTAWWHPDRPAHGAPVPGAGGRESSTSG